MITEDKFFIDVGSNISGKYIEKTVDYLFNFVKRKIITTRAIEKAYTGILKFISFNEALLDESFILQIPQGRKTIFECLSHNAIIINNVRLQEYRTKKMLEIETKYKDGKFKVISPNSGIPIQIAILQCSYRFDDAEQLSQFYEMDERQHCKDLEGYLLDISITNNSSFKFAPFIYSKSLPISKEDPYLLNLKKKSQLKANRTSQYALDNLLQKYIRKKEIYQKHIDDYHEAHTDIFTGQTRREREISLIHPYQIVATNKLSNDAMMDDPTYVATSKDDETKIILKLAINPGQTVAYRIISFADVARKAREKAIKEIRSKGKWKQK